MGLLFDLIREDAKEKGIKEGSIEIAKNMLKDGVDISVISKYTGLSEDIIQDLRAELNIA